MARKFSTGLRNALLGLVPSVTGTGISGTSGTKTIADTGNGLAIFQPGDKIIVPVALIAAGLGTVVTVATTGASLTVSETVLDQSAGASYTVSLANARAFRQIFTNCIIYIYSGAQPSDADQAEDATILAKITKSRGTVVAGVATNGLTWDAPSDGAITKPAGDTWEGLGLANGTAGWFRCYSNLIVTGASTTAFRFDGLVSASNGNGQLKLSTTTIQTGVPVAVTSATLSAAA